MSQPTKEAESQTDYGSTTEQYDTDDEGQIVVDSPPPTTKPEEAGAAAASSQQPATRIRTTRSRPATRVEQQSAQQELAAIRMQVNQEKNSQIFKKHQTTCRQNLNKER